MLKKAAFALLLLWIVAAALILMWEFKYSTIRGRIFCEDCDVNDLYAVAASHDFFGRGEYPFQWIIKVQRDGSFVLKDLPVGDTMEVHILSSNMVGAQYPNIRGAPFPGDCAGGVEENPFKIPRFPSGERVVEVVKYDFEALERKGHENAEVGGALAGTVACNGCESSPIYVLAYERDPRREFIRSDKPLAAVRIEKPGPWRLEGIPAGKKAYIIAFAILDENRTIVRKDYYKLNPQLVSSNEQTGLEMFINAQDAENSEADGEGGGVLDSSQSKASEPETKIDGPEMKNPIFEAATEEVGIEFEHSLRDRILYLPQGMGGGVCVIDMDDDGWEDLFFVNSGPESGETEGASGVESRFYLNRGGTFYDATDRAGVRVDGWGMGCAVGDFDNDGYQDLYVTRLGRNRLLQNLGDGRFRDVSATSGTDNALFGSSAAFLDYDRDGDLDLYAANYVDFNFEKNKITPEMEQNRGAAVYNTMIPIMFEGQPNALYRNDGGGKFSDLTAAAGVGNNENKLSKSLGVVSADLDADGWIDIFVANDTMPNAWYRNNHNGTFTDRAPAAGLADSRAGMGVGMADVDGNGALDLFLGHFQEESAALYLNRGDGTFYDDAERAGLAQKTYLPVSFGVGFLDYDNDGDLDIYIANGHVSPSQEAMKAGGKAFVPLQGLRDQLFRQDPGVTFKDASSEGGPAFYLQQVGRGAAFADFDRDGDVDIVNSNNHGSAVYLRNARGGFRNWIGVRLEGLESVRDAIGAVVTVKARDLVQTQAVASGGSYASQSSLILHFGLGRKLEAESVEVVWPSGRKSIVNSPEINSVVSIKEKYDY